MQTTKMFSYKNLSTYRNVLMGLQIILIIFFHFTEDCKIYDVRFSGLIYWFYKYIRSSGVDMFLLLSGIGLYFSWKTTPDSSIFYKKRYSRILIPYFIVAIPTWLWIDIFYLGKGWNEFIGDLLFISFFFEQTRLFWYILLIGICYWIFPYIFNVIETAADDISEKMRVLIFCTLSTVILVMLQQYHHDLYTNISIAISRIPPFIFGVLLGKIVYEKRSVSRKNIWIMLALAIVLAWPMQVAGKTILGVYSNAFLNYAFSLLFVLVLQYLSEKKCIWRIRFHNIITSVLGWLGKYTLELYLIHVALRRIMKSIGYPTYRLSYEGVLVIFSVILSVGVHKLVGYVQYKVFSF